MPDGVIYLANAGHPYPMLVTPIKTQYIDVQGSLPGLSNDYQYQATRFELSQDQRLILYTDGLFEIGTNNKQRDHSKSSMIDAIKKSSQFDLVNASQSIMSSYDRLTQANAKDDATLIIIEPKGY